MADLSFLDDDTTSIVRDVSSWFAKAKSASVAGSHAGELKHLLSGTNSIILLMKFGDIDADTQREYASMLVNSSARIRDILFTGENI